MNAFPPASPEHREVHELLPWLANGTLVGAARRQAEAHLQHCEPCRRELVAQQRLIAAMSEDGAIERMPASGLQRLRQRIDALDTAHTLQTADVAATVPAPPVASAPSGPAAARAAADSAWPLLRGGNAAVGAALLLCVFAGALWLQTQRHAGAANYYTVTSAAPQAAGAVIRAVFAPTVTLSELQALLDDAQLKIVAGPTAAGVYSLAMTAPASPDWSLQRLRRHAAVRFAEPIGAAVPSPP